MNLKTVPWWSIIVLVEISKCLSKGIISSTSVYFVSAEVTLHTATVLNFFVIVL